MGAAVSCFSLGREHGRRERLIGRYLEKATNIIRAREYGLPADPFRAAYGYLFLEDMYHRKFYFSNHDYIPTFFAINVSTGDVDLDGVTDLFVGKHPLNRTNTTNYVVLSSLVPSLRDVEVSPANSIVIGDGREGLHNFREDMDGDHLPDFLIAHGHDSAAGDLLLSRDIINETTLKGGPHRLGDIKSVGVGDLLEMYLGKHGLSSRHDLASYGLAEDDQIFVLDDYDGDGIREIGVVNRGGLVVLFSTASFGGAHQFRVSFHDDETSYAPRIAAIGRYDDDELDDFWIQRCSAATLSLISGASVKRADGASAEEVTLGEAAKVVIRHELPYQHPKEVPSLSGYSVLAGDYDEDGISDVAFGSGHMFQGRGSVFILLGKFLADTVPDGISTLDDRFIKLTSRQPNAWVAPLEFDAGRDYTGDGVADIVVGSDSDVQGGVFAGAVYVVDGRSLLEHWSGRDDRG